MLYHHTCTLIIYCISNMHILKVGLPFQLNPLTPEFVDSALKSAESFVNNPMFGYM